ncbi:unnamed protein product [Adineta ricciae]|uniref:Calponin-homology (CH) domain-containing protein n=1 Tax=Adineta ricciae TaxID=249248 RepID=A0A815SM71_ADIRI|nr:unnamed protein product [Adineta ricciae]CAF1491897.1 unnamed protein product [Adineta ricciae]
MNKQKNSLNHSLISSYDTLLWLDTIPLSRSIQNLEADFADGLLVAEIIAYFYPEYVDFGIFHIARNMSERVKNWRLLNSKVLPKIDFHTPGTIVHDIINEDHRTIELFLARLREKLEEHAFRTGRKSRVSWETWRSLSTERYRLPQIIVTPRQKAALVPSYGSLVRNGKLIDSYIDDNEEILMNKEEEIEILRAKLKRCEKVIHTQDKRIQELEDKIEKLRLK